MTRRLMVRHLGIAVGAALLLVAGFGLAGMAPRPLWFVALALAVGFGSVAVRLLVPQLTETFWPSRYDDEPGAQGTRTTDSRTQFLATWVQESSRDPETFAYRIRPLLADLARDRLVHRHGIDPVAEPARARQLTGEPLWDLLDDSTTRTASYAELDQAVQTIEKL